MSVNPLIPGNDTLEVRHAVRDVVHGEHPDGWRIAGPLNRRSRGSAHLAKETHAPAGGRRPGRRSLTPLIVVPLPQLGPRGSARLREGGEHPVKRTESEGNAKKIGRPMVEGSVLSGREQAWRRDGEGASRVKPCSFSTPGARKTCGSRTEHRHAAVWINPTIPHEDRATPCPTGSRVDQRYGGGNHHPVANLSRPGAQDRGWLHVIGLESCGTARTATGVGVQPLRLVAIDRWPNREPSAKQRLADQRLEVVSDGPRIRGVVLPHDHDQELLCRIHPRHRTGAPTARVLPGGGR